MTLIRAKDLRRVYEFCENGTRLFSCFIAYELCFEEHRWSDIRRWKIAPIVLNKNPLGMDIVLNPATGTKTYTVNTMANFKSVFTDKNYLIPIPQTEIYKNQLLTQNPGY